MVTCDRGQIKRRAKWRKENLQSLEMKERLPFFLIPSFFSQSKLEESDGDKEAAALVPVCARPVGGMDRVRRGGAGQWVSKVKWGRAREQRREGGDEREAGYRVVKPIKQKQTEIKQQISIIKKKS